MTKAQTAQGTQDTPKTPETPDIDALQAQIAELTDTIDCEKIARCAPCPGASLVMWSHVDDADRIASALNDGGSETIRVENTAAGAVVE